MNIQRTIPPAAALISFGDLLHGFTGLFVGKHNRTRLEDEVREYFSVKHVFLVSSGKAALALILIALKSMSSRQRVVIPAYTCFSVPSAIVKAGLHVSLCDVDPQTLDFNFDKLRRSLDDNTLCVVPTHLLGLSSDVDRVKELCRGKGVFVVEDVAQAMGVKHGDKLLGTIGDVGFFSLGRGKNITCGSGGIIVTKSDEIAGAIQVEYAKLKREPPMRLVRNFCATLGMRLLIDPRLYWFPAGLPFLGLGETKFDPDFPMHRMDRGRVGLLSHWRERLEQSNSARHTTAKSFIDHLAAVSHVIRSSSREQPMYLRLPVMMESRGMKERLCALSNEHGLGISPLYPTAVQSIKELQDEFRDKEFPASAKVADRLVTIPVHHLVSERDREKICNMVIGLCDVKSKNNVCSTILDHSKDRASAQV